MRPTRLGRFVSDLAHSTVAVIMAGGRGERLKQLTERRVKPAVPFGSKYRIIDFTLSNCVNSGIRQILVLTQYRADSLIEHVQRGWGHLRGELGEFVQLVPAQQKTGDFWYRGTADAVHQNLDLINRYEPEFVLVLAGDHVYKMDYGPMVAYHLDQEADITVGVVEVPLEEARGFGVMTVDENHRISQFNEKPEDPQPMPGRDDIALASMGIYVFKREYLESCLERDASAADSRHDFGKNIIPGAIESGRVYAYPFQDVKTKAQAYWRDVGTIDAYYQANMELVYVHPELNLYDEDWPIWTYQPHTPAAKFILDDEGRTGTAINSLVAGGCIVSGARIQESMLFYDVVVDERSSLLRSVALPYVQIGKDCRIRNAIIDEGCVIPDGTVIGENHADDAERFDVTNKGVVLVTADMIDRGAVEVTS